jgi:TRAP transporter TAXI family solute receptor
VWSARSGGGIFGAPEKTSGSSGYAKPVTQEGRDAEKFTGDKPDADQDKAAQKKRSADALADYRSSQEKSKEPDASPDSQSPGYSKPGGKVPAEVRSSGTAGKFDKEEVERAKKQRSKEALEAYKAERPKTYSEHPLFEGIRSRGGSNYTGYSKERDRYWGDKGWSYPSQMFKGPSSFGLWDAAFLYSLLNHADQPEIAAFGHHHQEDQGYKSWRRQVEEQARSDSRLRSRLSEMDGHIKRLQDQGVKKNAAYLPPGISPTLALSPEVVAARSAKKPTLRLATGPETGTYYGFGAMLKKAASDIDIQVIVTEGSQENLELILAHKADAALVQSDVLARIPLKETEQTAVYFEPVQLIANAQSGIKSVKDLKAGKHRILIGPKGSGTSMTWEGLCRLDDAYGKIPTEHADYDKALVQVASDPNALMLFVGGLNSPLIRAADIFAAQRGDLRLVAVDDWDFDDKKDRHGNPIYTFVKIAKGTYPHLQKGVLWEKEIETVAVKAVLTVRTDWIREHGPDALDALTTALEDVKPDLLKLVHGQW